MKRRRASDLPYTVEGCCLAVPDDEKDFEPIARFKHENDARLFMRTVAQINGESAAIDRVYCRLKNVNKILST